MRARQQVVYCNDGKRYRKIKPEFWEVYEEKRHSAQFVRDAIDGQLDDIIATVLQGYTSDSFTSDDVGVMVISEVDKSVVQAVEDIIGD